MSLASRPDEQLGPLSPVADWVRYHFSQQLTIIELEFCKSGLQLRQKHTRFNRLSTASRSLDVNHTQTPLN
jgi:hypothetical protein